MWILKRMKGIKEYIKYALKRCPEASRGVEQNTFAGYKEVKGELGFLG